MELYPYYPSHPLFARIFEIARELWPTKALAYVGNEGGTIYMQERGNATPFVFHERRLDPRYPIHLRGDERAVRCKHH